MKFISNVLLACILIISFEFWGCLKDKTSIPVEAPPDESEKILFYLEAEGDYINSTQMPSLVDVDEVFSNMQTYLLLDIRPSIEFTSGHISGAINRTPAQLISFLDSVDFRSFPKIVIVSKNGQSSAFYTCLLRLYGFNNVYSMNFGMAAWNQVFSDEWFNALQIDTSLLRTYTADNSPKPPFTPLPAVSLNGSSLQESVKQRIQDLMQVAFDDDLIESENTATINYEWLMNHAENFLIVCFDTLRLYKDVVDGIYHPADAVSIHPAPRSELSSSQYLQSIPSNKESALYSANGQLSAFAVAYLRLLGYDAKSVLFGSNNMYYPLLLNSETFHSEAFSADKIRNYPIANGN